MKGSIAGRCTYRVSPAAFWDYHDWVYTNQKDITLENFDAKFQEYAKSKGLDTLQLGRCMDDKTSAAEVEKSSTWATNWRSVRLPRCSSTAESWKAASSGTCCSSCCRSRSITRRPRPRPWRRPTPKKEDDSCCTVEIPKVGRQEIGGRHARCGHASERARKIAFSILLLCPLALTAADVQPDEYLAHVKYLASPQLKGRATGSPEIEKAAAYIAGQFRSFGLQPLDGKSAAESRISSWLFPRNWARNWGRTTRFLIATASPKETLTRGPGFRSLHFLDQREIPRPGGLCGLRHHRQGT